VWTRETGIRGLRNLPGAIATVAPCCHTLNDRGEVVGFSIDSMGNPSAFVWRDHRMMDLNTLIPADSPLYLQQALSINDAREIVRQGITKDGEFHAFLATPCDR
jgi:probable HAF family extracellular repeat protein